MTLSPLLALLTPPGAATPQTIGRAPIDAACTMSGVEPIDGAQVHPATFLLLVSCPGKAIVILGRGARPTTLAGQRYTVLDRKTLTVAPRETVQLARGACLIGHNPVRGAVVVKGLWGSRSRITPRTGLVLVLGPSPDRTRLIPIVARTLRCEADEP